MELVTMPLAKWRPIQTRHPRARLLDTRIFYPLSLGWQKTLASSARVTNIFIDVHEWNNPTACPAALSHPEQQLAGGASPLQIGMGGGGVCQGIGLADPDPEPSRLPQIEQLARPPGDFFPVSNEIAQHRAGYR